MRRGLTLLEVMITLTIVVLMIGMMVVFLNPADQLSKAEESVIRSELSLIRQSLNQVVVSNEAIIPTEIADAGLSGFQEIGNSAGSYDICDLVVPSQLLILPFAEGGHFTDCTDYALGYELQFTASPEAIVLRDPVSGIETEQIRLRWLWF